MADLTKEKIIDTLKAVKFEDGSNIIDRGVVSEVVIANGKVYFAMDAGTDDPAIFEPLLPYCSFRSASLCPCTSALGL
jgi:hypothetical protein